LGLGIRLALEDRVRVRFEVRVRSILFICTTANENVNRKKAVLWYIIIDNSSGRSVANLW